MMISRVNSVQNNKRQNFGLNVKIAGQVKPSDLPKAQEGKAALEQLAPRVQSSITIFGVSGNLLKCSMEPSAALQKKPVRATNLSTNEKLSLDRADLSISLPALKDPKASQNFLQKTIVGYEKWVASHK